MENVILETKKVGSNGFWNIRNQLNDFVVQNFELLYEGAVRLKLNLEIDRYTPKRVQINDTHLNYVSGLKYADGHRAPSDEPPTENQLRNTIRDLQILIDAAAEVSPSTFALKIKDNR
jgi:hypothetical protein